MSISRKTIATSSALPYRMVRGLYRGIRGFALPTPGVIVKPLLWAYLFLRSVWHFVLRVFIAEPLFKAYCKSYGKNLHTGIFVHWVMGKGSIFIGDNVTIDGKSSFNFANRFSHTPTLEIGNNTGIGHNCSFTVAKRITIGNNCMIAAGTKISDSNGHPINPISRLNHLPPEEESIHPVIIQDNVWIGQDCFIFPGVTIGEGSVISARSVVRSNIPSYTIVSGNPAKKRASLKVLMENNIEKVEND